MELIWLLLVPLLSIFLTHLAARVAPQLASKGFDVVDRRRASTVVTCV